MMSAYDPWVNMLRTTVATFAAGVGGADAITVVPFDSPLGDPTRSGAGSRATPCTPHRPSPTSPGSPTRPAARTPSRSSPTTSRSRRGSCSDGWTTVRTWRP